MMWKKRKLRDQKEEIRALKEELRALRWKLERRECQIASFWTDNPRQWWGWGGCCGPYGAFLRNLKERGDDGRQTNRRHCPLQGDGRVR